MPLDGADLVGMEVASREVEMVDGAHHLKVGTDLRAVAHRQQRAILRMAEAEMHAGMVGEPWFAELVQQEDEATGIAAEMVAEQGAELGARRHEATLQQRTDEALRAVALLIGKQGLAAWRLVVERPGPELDVVSAHATAAILDTPSAVG